MNDDKQMEELIEERFQTASWYGAVPVEEAIEGMLTYRRELSAEERAIFDAEVRRGRHPSLVVETIELMSGRLLPKSAVQRRKKVARAS